MNNYKINSLQFCSILIMLIVSSFLGTGIISVIKTCAVDSPITILITSIIGILIILLFLLIFNYEPDLTIFKKTKKLTGNFTGSIINFGLIALIVIRGIGSFYNLNSFIVSQFFSDNSKYIIAFLFSLIIIFANIKGIETLSRVSLILLGINIILIVISHLGLLPFIDYNNFKPMLEHGLSKPLFGSLYVISHNITPLFLLLIIPKNNIIRNKSFSKHIILSYLISMFLIFTVLFFTLGVLGIDLTSNYQYPSYAVLKNISLLGFLDRIENFLTIQWLFGLFISLSIIVYCISNGIKYNHKSKLLIIFSTTIIVISSFLFFDNITNFNHFTHHYAFVLQLIFLSIFILMGLIILIKRKKA